MMRLRTAVLALALALPFVLAVAAGPLEPPVRALLGLEAEGAPVARPCTGLGPQNVRLPGGDPAGSTWQSATPSPLARAEIGAAELDGLVYLVGGQGPGGRSTGAVLAFEPRTKRFSPMPPVPDRVDHPLVTTDGRELFVVGGYRDSEPLNTGWRYSPATRRWSALPSMRVARGGLGGGVIDGRLYAVTGAPRTWPNEYVRPYDVTEVLDLRTGRWSFGPPIPVARHHLGTATVDGAVYIVGGRNPDDFSLRRVDRLDPRTGRWEQAAPLPQGVAAPMVAATEHGLVVAGGSDPERWEGEGGGWVTPAAWAFDARRDRWRRLPDLRVASHQGAAGVVDGRAYVFEGAPCPGFARTHAVETLRLPAD